MNYLAFDEYCEKAKIEVKNSEELKNYTSFKIGGKADRVCLVPSPETLKDVVRLLKDEDIPHFVIGKGSNLLVSDTGFRGVVLKLCEEFSEIKLISEDEISCGAGVNLSNLCIFAKNNGLSGLEFAYGIPGCVGGAVYMNAGAYGGEMKDVIKTATHMTKDGEFASLNNEQMKLSYRKSIYTKSENVICSVILKLNKGDKDEISSKMDETLKKRVDKQPLEYPSAGSTFKRPEKGYASALVDECGLKGKSVGGAMVSEKHAGFLINYDNATCEDMLGLIEEVKKEVYDKKGIMLECEVELIGFN